MGQGASEGARGNAGRVPWQRGEVVLRTATDITLTLTPRDANNIARAIRIQATTRRVDVAENLRDAAFGAGAFTPLRENDDVRFGSYTLTVQTADTLRLESWIAATTTGRYGVVITVQRTPANAWRVLGIGALIAHHTLR